MLINYLLFCQPLLSYIVPVLQSLFCFVFQSRLKAFQVFSSSISVILLMRNVSVFRIVKQQPAAADNAEKFTLGEYRVNDLEQSGITLFYNGFSRLSGLGGKVHMCNSAYEALALVVSLDDRAEVVGPFLKIAYPDSVNIKNVELSSDLLYISFSSSIHFSRGKISVSFIFLFLL